MSETELQVVCRECGSEVSPYVTECPFCGTRVRKRAPKLRHYEDHFEPKPTARARLRRRLPSIRPGRPSLGADVAGGLTVPAAVIGASACLTLARVAGDLSLLQVGAISGDVGSEWWRFLTAPFAYDNVGYLFVVAVALTIFGSGLQRALGRFATVVLILGCGSLGALAGYGMADVLGLDNPLIAGGNGMALGVVSAWVFIRRGEAKVGGADPPDWIGAGIAGVVILLLPAVESSADLLTGVSGGLIGCVLGFIAAAKRPQ